VGNKIEIKLSVLIVILLVNCIVVYSGKEPEPSGKKPPIAQYFQRIDGYETVRHVDLEDNALNMLELDDYTFADYTGQGKKINLYIGYYYSAKKANASHSPLICYPSHGWKIENKPVAGSLSIGPYQINYEEIVTSSDQQKELVLYWYQSRLDTNTTATKNKINIAVNKLTKKDEQHAFVRVAVPFADLTYADTKQTALDFIQAFYPQFIWFITGENDPELPGKQNL
jgi:EpsI family protein